jgi:hypothetical protein
VSQRHSCHVVRGEKYEKEWEGVQSPPGQSMQSHRSRRLCKEPTVVGLPVLACATGSGGRRRCVHERLQTLRRMSGQVKDCRQDYKVSNKVTILNAED